VSMAGEPAYIAALADGTTRVVSVAGRVSSGFDARLLADATARAGAHDVRQLDRYDAYYRDRRRVRPLPVLVVQFDDVNRSRFYVDVKTARIEAAYGDSDWPTRWLYHGLHSLDVPWLYAHRPLWDIVVIAFMLGGAALSSTGLVLAWRVLVRWPGAYA